MITRLNDILNRAQKIENKDLYHNLVNHTSTVPDGEAFIKQTERAKEILIEINKPNSYRDQLELEFTTIIRHLKDWLDTHNWV